MKRLNIIYGNANIEKRKYIADGLNKINPYFFSIIMEDLIEQIKSKNWTKTSKVWKQENNWYFMEKCIMLFSHYNMLFVESTASGIEWEMVKFTTLNYKSIGALFIIPFSEEQFRLIKNNNSNSGFPKHISKESIEKIGSFASNAIYNNSYSDNNDKFYILEKNMKHISFNRFFNDNVFSKLNISVNKHIINLLSKKLILHLDSNGLDKQSAPSKDYMLAKDISKMRSKGNGLSSWISNGLNKKYSISSIELFLLELEKIIEEIIRRNTVTEKKGIPGVEVFYKTKYSRQKNSAKDKVIHIHYKTRKLFKFTDDKIGNTLKENAEELNRKLANQYEKVRVKTSFAYRKKNDTETFNHINAIKKHISNKSAFFYKLDIKDFFNSINSSEIDLFVNEHFNNDEETIKMYENFKSLSHEIISTKKVDKIGNITKGFPQGLSPSSTISNIILIKLDKHFENYKDICYTRYSDDILISTKANQPFFELYKAKKVIDRYLSNLKLEQNDKSRLIDLNNESLKYLGINLHKGKKDGVVYPTLGRAYQRRIDALTNKNKLELIEIEVLKGLSNYKEYFEYNLSKLTYDLKPIPEYSDPKIELREMICKRLLRAKGNTIVLKLTDIKTNTKLLIEISENSGNTQEIFKLDYFEIIDKDNKDKFNKIENTKTPNNFKENYESMIIIEEYNDSLKVLVSKIEHQYELSMDGKTEYEEMAWIFKEFML